jgi:predicted DNA-binding transcriptional regulator AlpA
MNNPFLEIDRRLSNIETLILNSLNKRTEATQNEIEKPIKLDDVVKLTGLTKPTLYGYVQRNELPHFKKGNRLYFFKSEIIDWIKTGKKKTQKEIEAEANAYLSNQKKGFR